MNPDFVNARQAALDTWLRAVVDACPRLEGARLVDRFLMPAADAFHNVVIVDDGRRSEGGEAQKRKQFVHETTINDPLRFTDGPFGARFLGMAHHLRHAKLREEQRMENLKAKAREGGDAEDNLETLRRVNTGDFESLRVIGKGSFGKVVVARHKKSKEIYAVKILEKANICKRKQIEHTKTERRVMARVHHPFIVELHYAFQSRTRLYMVLEFVQGGELFHHLGKFKSFPEDWARMWTAEIVLALQYLHEQHIMFRDLKPENILFDKDGHVKLIDFGLCKEGITDGATGATSFCGTPEYLAPEILNRVGHGTAVDFWSLGMVLHEMLTGLPPWYSRNKRRLFDRIRNAALEFPRSVSAPARNLIAGLLVRDPRQRLGNRGTGVMEIRTHPFFHGIDWDALLQRKVVAPFRPSISTSSDGKPDTSNFDAAFTGMPLNDLESSGGGSGDITAPLGSDAASLPKDLCDNWILVGTES
ncbi:Protein kinase, putative [Hondaea fermentalgiana]|uniref:Protein kinase, putative n=1 Tax=Hondaea fermentalgiana TaxID=2315210 RepID=A0A2R5GTZ8_9STRA|nr:Protein kinase, putative [Hondaea fermentalgiana]|eukprot:GBG31364.1 Protein kinase, putative [Hondaea fermentalgiana]